MSKRKIFTLSFILSVVILSMLSPFFQFSKITITGNAQVEDGDIIANILEQSNNFFLFNPRSVRRNIIKNPYIADVTFNRVFPNALEVTVQERFLSGYIEYLNGMFLYIDEDGRVLEVRSYMSQDLPIITGLQFASINLGQILEVDNPEAFNIVVAYAGLINRHGFAGVISELDVSDASNARLRINNAEVYLGDTRNAQEKILTLREIVDVWPLLENVRGFLDLREPNSEYFFRLFT